MLKNEEGYKDPTAEKAMYHLKRKGGVMREPEMERADQLRPHVPTLDGWSEAEEQEALMNWARMSCGKYPPLFWLLHIPNGGTRHPAEALHLKRMGVKPGVPDLCLPYPVKPFHSLWIEMKSEKGRPTALQKEWIEQLRKYGHAAWVCMGFSAAQDCLLAYLQGRMPTQDKTGLKSNIIWSGGVSNERD